MTVQQIEVTEQMASLRLDKALAMTDNGWSRTQISTWLTEGRITREGDVPKANYKVKAGEVYTVDVPEEEVFEIIPQDLALTIIYEDDDVAVVYKPRGMVVHPAPGHMKDTLVNGLAYQLNTLSDMNGELRPGIVHRIDKDTSEIGRASCRERV